MSRSLVRMDPGSSGSMAVQRFGKVFEELGRSKKELQDLGREIDRELDFQMTPWQKVARKVMRGASFLPFVGKRAQQYSDPLSTIEFRLRDFLNGIQSSLGKLADIARSKNEETIQLQEDLARAIQEEWTLDQLRNYLIEKSGIAVYDQVKELMDFELSRMSEEEKKKKREVFLADMRANVMAGGQLMGLLEQTVMNALGVFEGALMQYRSFVTIAAPIKAIRDTASTLVDTTDAMYLASGVLKQTLEKSVEAIEAAGEAARMAESYRVNNPDMIGALANAQRQLSRTLPSEIKLTRLALPAPVPGSQTRLLDENTFEAGG